MKPLIHILHEEMETLLWNVMAKFVKSKYLTNKKDGEKCAVSANELLLVQTADKNVVKNLKNIDIGTKAKGLFLPSALDIDENEKKFRSDCLQAYQKTTEYLKSMLPFNSFIQNSAFINLENKNFNGSLVGISNLAQMITSALPNVLTAVFSKKSDLTGEEVCDTLRTEWRLNQTESIPESAYQLVVETKISSRKQNSYWELVFYLAGVDHISKELPPCDKEKFVLYLQKLYSSDGQLKYPIIVSLFKLVLSISHGNSAPENGFSINKAMLDIHGYSLGESTIEALRFVKDAILKRSFILDIPITRSLLHNVRLKETVHG